MENELRKTINELNIKDPKEVKSIITMRPVIIVSTAHSKERENKRITIDGTVPKATYRALGVNDVKDIMHKVANKLEPIIKSKAQELKNLKPQSKTDVNLSIRTLIRTKVKGKDGVERPLNLRLEMVITVYISLLNDGNKNLCDMADLYTTEGNKEVQAKASTKAAREILERALANQTIDTPIVRFITGITGIREESDPQLFKANRSSVVVVKDTTKDLPLEKVKQIIKEVESIPLTDNRQDCRTKNLRALIKQMEEISNESTNT